MMRFAGWVVGLVFSVAFWTLGVIVALDLWRSL